MRNLFATILLIFLAGCASTKGYSGATLPDGEVAKIYASKAVKTPHGKQTVLIGEANGKVVGGGAKGYPEFVAVPPGEANIKYKIHTRSLGKAVGMGLVAGLTGGLGAAIAMEANDKPEDRTSYTFNVEKGKAYRINLRYEDAAPNVPILWLEEHVPPAPYRDPNAGR